MIIVVDYGMGNLLSVSRKISKITNKVKISSDPLDIINADKIILPGVGHFANGVKKIKEYNLWDVLNNEVLIKKKPVLGICLGMQLMSKYSEEGNEQGFGWIDGKVKLFKSDNIRLKVPQMGWNTITQKKPSLLLNKVDDKSEFYFVHSYYLDSNNPNEVLATTDYIKKFTSAIERDNIFGTQFHPEKSHTIGEKLLTNFINL